MNPKIRRFLLLAPALLLLLSTVTPACLGSGEPPTVDCATADVPSYSTMTVWDSCTPCHRDYGSYDAAVRRADSAQKAVANGDMPRGRYSITGEEEDSLYAWAQCGTPQ